MQSHSHTSHFKPVPDARALFVFFFVFCRFLLICASPYHGQNPRTTFCNTDPQDLKPQPSVIGGRGLLPMHTRPLWCRRSPVRLAARCA